jgi:hypothetical protein
MKFMMARVVAFLIAVILTGSLFGESAHAHFDAGTAHVVKKEDSCFSSGRHGLGLSAKAKCSVSPSTHDGSHDDCPDCNTCHHAAAVIPRHKICLVAGELPLIRTISFAKAFRTVLDGPVEPPRS